MIGKTISHYRILSKLGEGGMGVVYEAEDTKLRRTVALKFLSPQAIGADEEKARFIHEAQAAAALNHPNICTVYEIDECEGQSFIAMEYIDGQVLKEMISVKPLPLSDVVSIAAQLAEGLQAAHEKHVIHRDIKPANIMITAKGRSKIMDFGLAKSPSRTKLTQANITLGTIAYMSPEQSRGEKVDHRTDIWSLGVVLYEMVTGTLPFKGDFEQAVVYSILNETPEPVTSMRTGVPAELERIVNKCMEKDAAERYQDASDLLADLRRYQRIGSTKAFSFQHERTKKMGMKSAKWWVPAGGVFAAIAVLAALIFSNYSTIFKGQTKSDRVMLAVIPFVNLGPVGDSYFANGITDAITARLAGIHGLGVISRQSSMQYKDSDKSIKQIGKELGVEYVLEGTIQRERPADSASRLRCIPQLIRVADDTHIWAATYDREVKEVFKVQSEIAEQVARELDITVLTDERRLLGIKPTDNLEAYECFLRGNSYVDHMTVGDFHSAVEMYERAVALDPRFVGAWAALSRTYAGLYWIFGQSEQVEKARRAADEAMRLAPDLPETQVALGYLYYIDRDFDMALECFVKGRRQRPSDSEAIRGIGVTLRRQGRMNDALTNFKNLEQMDPRSCEVHFDLIGDTYYWLRRFDEAQHHLNQALLLCPGASIIYLVKAQVLLNRDGDIRGAGRVLAEAMERCSPADFVEYLGWGGIRSQIRIMPDAYAVILDKLGLGKRYANSPADTAYMYLSKAVLGFQLNREQKARTYCDSVIAYLESNIERMPKSAFTPHLYMALALAYAGLGAKEQAVHTGEKAVNMCPVTKDAIAGHILLSELAEIYLECGEYEAAIDQLERLLSVPSDISVALLRIDPLWDPLRDNIRFQRIIKNNSVRGS